MRVSETVATSGGPAVAEVLVCDAVGCEERTTADAPVGWVSLERMGPARIIGDLFAEPAHVCSLDCALVLLTLAVAKERP